MKLIILAALGLAAAQAVAQTETSDRDQQWIFRDRHGDGGESPTAIFLSWSYAHVILKAECKADEFGNSGKAGNGGITLYYYPEGAMLTEDESGGNRDQSFEPFGFSRGKRSISFPAIVKGQVVLGDIAVTPKLLSILKPGGDELEIEAANVMEEPWYAGQAEPLYRLAQVCAAK
jgi:hypothetical protein